MKLTIQDLPALGIAVSEFAWERRRKMAFVRIWGVLTALALVLLTFLQAVVKIAVWEIGNFRPDVVNDTWLMFNSWLYNKWQIGWALSSALLGSLFLCNFVSDELLTKVSRSKALELSAMTFGLGIVASIRQVLYTEGYIVVWGPLILVLSFAFGFASVWVTKHLNQRHGLS